jgi:ABC-type transport system substrate-binding protein
MSNALQATIGGAPFNECHSADPRYDALFQEVVTTLDLTKRYELIHEMQQLEWNGSGDGFIIPYFFPAIDGYTKRVQGIQTSKTGLPMGNWNFKKLWFA